MNPSGIEFEIGQDRYKRRTRLIGKTEGADFVWSIKSDQLAQRDEGEEIRSLTTAQLKMIGEAIQGISK